MRVKTPMGLEGFEVGKHLRPISESLGIYEGIRFWAKKTLQFFFPSLQLNHTSRR